MRDSFKVSAKRHSKDRPAILLVANFDSSVGYAWWLMESFWEVIASHFQDRYLSILAFPKINGLSPVIANAPIQPDEFNFSVTKISTVLRQCSWLRQHNVRAIYFSDQALTHWRYLLFRLAGVKRIVVHDHTPGLRTPPTGIKKLLKQAYRRIPWISVDLAIGATDFVRQRLEHTAMLPGSRCAVAPNGIPPDRASGEEPANLESEFGIPVDRKVLVSCSRAHPYKHVDFVIRALAQLVNSGRSDVHFLFIGDGPHLSELERLAREEGVGDFCTFAGRRSDVARILRACDFAIHPSEGEVGYSLSVLEYMRAGLPVIVPSNPSVCLATEHGRNGLIYPQGDLDAARLAIVQLLDQPELREHMGAVALESVRTRYSIKKTHVALLGALERVM